MKIKKPAKLLISQASNIVLKITISWLPQQFYMTQ